MQIVRFKPFLFSQLFIFVQMVVAYYALAPFSKGNYLAALMIGIFIMDELLTLMMTAEIGDE